MQPSILINYHNSMCDLKAICFSPFVWRFHRIQFKLIYDNNDDDEKVFFWLLIFSIMTEKQWQRIIILNEIDLFSLTVFFFIRRLITVLLHAIVWVECLTVYYRRKMLNSTFQSITSPPHLLRLHYYLTLCMLRRKGEGGGGQTLRISPQERKKTPSTGSMCSIDAMDLKYNDHGYIIPNVPI